MLRIAHITDTHISSEELTMDGIDTRETFLQVLKSISEQSFDIIIHTGDACFPDGNKEVYSWLKKRLDDTGIPYFVTPGNHDNVFMMQEIFNLRDLPPKVITTGAVGVKGQTLMFLDSSSERLNMKQVIWLKREISVQEDQLVLFQHHPPFPCGVRVMDEKYPYKSPDLFCRTVLDTGRSLTIFSGHYHIEKTVRKDSPDITVYITPPTLGSLDPDATDYTVNDPRPGWREIIMDRQKVIETRCHYLNINS